MIQDWSRYPELRWLDRYHWVPGLSLAVLCWLLAGWSGLVWGFVVSTVICYHATFSINSLRLADTMSVRRFSRRMAFSFDHVLVNMTHRLWIITGVTAV